MGDHRESLPTQMELEISAGMGPKRQSASTRAPVRWTGSRAPEVPQTKGRTAAPLPAAPASISARTLPPETTYGWSTGGRRSRWRRIDPATDKYLRPDAVPPKRGAHKKKYWRMMHGEQLKRLAEQRRQDALGRQDVRALSSSAPDPDVVHVVGWMVHQLADRHSPSNLILNRARRCARPRPGDLGPVLGRDDDDLVWTAERSHGVMSGASARSSMFINFSVLAVDTAVTAVS